MPSFIEPLPPRTLLSSAPLNLHVGGLDTRFASNGSAPISLPANHQFSSSSLLSQPDGKLLVAGTLSPTPNTSGTADFFLARLNPDGSPDTSFGTSGQITLDFQSTSDSLSNISLLPDGKILADGATATPSNDLIGPNTDTDLAIARLNSDGSLDTTFNSTGKLILDLSTPRFQAYNGDAQNLPTADVANAAAQLPTGQLLIAGTMFADDFLAGDMFLLRLNPDGSLDTSFGYNSSGLAPAQFAGDTVANAMLVQPSGNVLLGGADTSGGFTQMALVRFTPAGLYDTSFGTGGHETFAFSEDFDTITALAQGPNNKILAAGTVIRGSLNKPASPEGDLALLRLNPGGKPDKTFGIAGLDGLTLTNFPTQQFASVSSISLQPTGKILLGGKAAKTTKALLADNRSPFVARFTAKGLPDPTFGSQGFALLAAPSVAPNLHSPGTTPVGSHGNSISTLPREQLLRTFLAGAEGAIAFTPAGFPRALTSSSSSSASVLAVTPDSPDLIGLLSPSKISSPLHPGSKSSALLSLGNAGTTPASGSVPVSLYLSKSKKLPKSATPFFSTSLTLFIKPNGLKSKILHFTLPPTLKPGSYYLIALLNPTNSPVSELNTLNNTLPSPTPLILTRAAR